MLEKKLEVRERIRQIDAAIGRAIKYARVQAGAKQEELAEALGCTFQQVQKYEKGLNCVTAGKLAEIAKVVKKPISYFYDACVDEDLVSVAKGCTTVKFISDYTKIKNPKMQKQIRALARVAANTEADEE